MKPGSRVKLTASYTAQSTNPSAFKQLRGIALEPTPHIIKLQTHTLVLWDDAAVAYPVLTNYLEVEECDESPASQPSDECR